MPSRSQIESVIGGMGLSMGEKLSLRSILQAMQAGGEKVKTDKSLTEEQKTTKILGIRQDALGQTKKILTPAQQAQLSALFLPKS